MIIAIVKNNRILKNFLSEEISGDYVIKDAENNVIGNVVANNSDWFFYTNKGYQIVSTSTNGIPIKEFTQISIKNIADDSIIFIYSYPTNIANNAEYRVKKQQIIIGNNNSADIVYSSNLMKEKHAQITYENNRIVIEAFENGVFVNDRLIKRKRLDHGDIVFIHGLKLLCISDFIVIINLVSQNKVSINPSAFEQIVLQKQMINDDSFEKETESELFGESDYFLRSPRFKTTVLHEEIKISPPPDVQRQQMQPAILTIGPQLTMMLSSAITLFTTLSAVASGRQTMAASVPSILLTTVMMISSFLWPTVTRKWNKRENRRKEIKRLKTYRVYLQKKDKEITNIIENQRQILMENNVTLEECQQIIFQKKRSLWERTLEDEDFLTTRIGIGYVKPDIEITYDEQDFSMEDDVLKDELKDLVKKYDYVEEAPLNFSFLKNRISAIVGNFGILQSFIESIILQIATFHLYSELKIIIFTNENKSRDWNFIKFLPHCWDNQRIRRFIAASVDEKKSISSYLENIIQERENALHPEENKKQEDAINENAYKKFNCYYLIITDDITSCRNLDAIVRILNMKENLGFSMIIKNNRIANLPNQCTTFLNITDDISGMFGNELNAIEQKQFKADLNKTINVEDCFRQIANIHVQIPKEKYELPKSVGFMEMYGVGNVEQFNSSDRWTQNNPVVSLSVPVGIDQNGELFNMDIHEKAYGPHGLVAGTTGSGKSEWIITYILSLAVNFSPLEVQFVLIDYKGGGLAGSFENKETGIKLPHLAGTITNLDKSEIRRSLASLEAESKRRQRMFNEAREKLNDSSMNIYKYQQYYRKGMLDEPLSHLFLISDEFAELKAQEPEFLEQLVSIARIGRSLGIHLILATQKPAGVVDEQMWSNSRFKVCLRVQDKQDSQDMIKCDDAAYLKQTGAFYFQVGLNEFFGLGQSAYAGVKYNPTNIVKKNIETSLEVVDRTGNVINTVDYIKEKTDNSTAKGEELLNIIKYLSDIAKKQQISSRKLWLDAMPEIIYADFLKQKYGFKREPFQIKPIIGEYDNPFQQLQQVLQVDINASNVYIAGLSGSGKEKLLQTMVYSIITNYSPQEVALYLCDFGAETLGMFEQAPHVGDVVFANDKVKIENLNRFIKKEINDRRAKYRDYGGTYESYIKYSKDKDRLIIVVINDIGFIKENYNDIFIDFENIIIESAKYGVVFVETSLEATIHKSKVLSAFENKYILKMVPSDYEAILGSKARGINPKELKGRGLFQKNNEIYEFQTASICQEESLQQRVKELCQKIYEMYKFKNDPIPSIPNPINMDVINVNKVNINSICVGYSKATIEPIYFDLQKNQSTLILGTKKYQIRNYCRVLNMQLDIAAEKGTKVYLFDPENIFKSEKYNKIIHVESKEINNTLKNLLIYINNESDKYNSMEDKSLYKAPSRSCIVFYSIYQVFSICENKIVDMLNEAFTKARELELFDFVIVDVANDFKEVQRNKAIIQMFVESNGVLISNVGDNQMTIELNTKDIRVKDALLDREGYIVERGKAKLSQVLQYEGDEEDE